MPVVSRFYGITVKMYYDDHAPPHFHAQYGGDEAVLSIETREILRGELPKRAAQLIDEWAALHREELRNNWTRARNAEPIEPIEPLP
jgi:hypothetical protein